jgi:CheY-like chemotaxis protein
MSGPTADQTTILIVEDNYLLLEMLVALFEQEGLRTLTASSGEAALTLLRERGTAIGWLFTDIRLPGLIDGWMVASGRRIRAFLTRAPPGLRRTGSPIRHPPRSSG